MECRNAERTLSRIEDMLRLYQPFIHDNDYVFRSDHIRALDARMHPNDRAWLSFDIDSLDWRRYWLDVHVPGLETWSLPLLRGERIPEDLPQLPRRLTAPTAWPPPQPYSLGGAAE